jgi:homoserine kinase
MAGEQAGCGAVHPDNVAPALYGGFVLARSADPPDIVRLPVPAGLACAVLHPAMEVHTGTARALLGDTVPLKDAVRQWANLGALVSALHTGDLALLGRSLEDHVAEPKRAGLVPGFHAVKAAALAGGALGCSLSGSGPSMFALARSLDEATAAGRAMAAAWAATSSGIPADLWVSPVGTSGARVITAEAAR